MKLSNLSQEFIDYKSISLQPRTLYLYKTRLEFFERFFNKGMVEVDLLDISRITNYMKENDYSSSTIASYVHTMRSFLKYAHMTGKTKIPYEMIESPKIKESVPKVMSFRVYEQIDLFFSQKNDFKSLEKRLVFALLWDTGMRIGELTNLKEQDINIPQKFARIERQKNLQNHVVMWSEGTQALLLRYLEMKRSLALGEKYLFMSRSRPKSITNYTIAVWLAETCELLGFERYNLHSFRHAKAHRILEQTGRQEDIKQILGHKSITSSDKYTRLHTSEQLRIQSKYLNEEGNSLLQDNSRDGKWVFLHENQGKAII